MKEIFSYLKKFKINKKTMIFLLVFILGIIFMMFPESEVQDKNFSREEQLEGRLRDIIESIDGVKKVKIMISLNNELEKSNFFGDEKKEAENKIMGVSVVADCNREEVKNNIYRATKGALGIDAHKIEVIINIRKD